MEEEDLNTWGRLRRVEFQRIRIPNLRGESTDSSTEVEIPFTTVPDFSSRYPWQLSTTAAFEFLRHLPLISVSTLPENTRACDICLEPYMSGEDPEKPTKLPCQHVLGRKCIGKWILPRETRPNTTCPVCRSELFSDERFKPTLFSPPEEGDVADWVGETTLSYEGDPNAEERMELLVQELQRVGSVLGGEPTSSTAEVMRSALNQHDELMRRLDGRLAGHRNRERLAEDGGEPLRPSDRAELNSLQRRLPHLLELSQELHTVAERMLADRQEDAEETATAGDGVGGDGDS
ncbi:hypothetical protein HO133_006401 [Letharia lupina]|uniref:RING-type domain-containing protein n=1 Tax=Letharia lupina TaxID=560253 RepID=A0A8H6C7D3_9LECA|nr:uncharacterized protein HO133_006401 [Letharia lupina]KAF6217989.1 hypothetical protein HO133_006401 [Letharia lupina]